MKLVSDRTREIIESLLEANDYMTVSEIGKVLKVTNRTIYRQLPEVNQVLEFYGLRLENVAKKGMQILGPLSQMKKLSNDFEEQKTEQVYSGTDRIHLIIMKMLFRDDYMKTRSFAIDLHTSVQTIRNDYEQVREILDSHEIQFLTKKGEGVRVSGEERNKRHLCVSILLQHITPNVMLDWLKGKQNKVNPYLEIIKEWGYEDTLEILYNSVSQMIIQSKVMVSDRELQEFLLLLTLFIKRHKVMEDENNMLSIHGNSTEPEHEIYGEIITFLLEEFRMELYENEKNYFYWLIHFFLVRTGSREKTEKSTILLLDSITRLIAKVALKFQFPFDTDKNLAWNLMLHTKIALERIESGMSVSNPIRDEIYDSNPKLYDLVKESLGEIFPAIEIPEDEISYIAIYFIASREYLSKASISALVVCTTGIGSSKMLRSRLEREFAEIRVTKILTLHKLEQEDFSQYDLIISTTTLEMEEDKYLLVSPLLNEKDMEEVRKKINSLKRKG